MRPFSGTPRAALPLATAQVNRERARRRSGDRAYPLTYMELDHDPEYVLCNDRLTPFRLNNATADEMYWKVRRDVILRNTGELPVEIVGPDAEELLKADRARRLRRHGQDRIRRQGRHSSRSTGAAPCGACGSTGDSLASVESCAAMGPWPGR